MMKSLKTNTAVTRVRRNVSADNGDASYTPGLALSDTSELMMSDKMVKLRRRQKHHQNCLFGTFLLLLMLALGGTKIIVSNHTTIGTTTNSSNNYNDEISNNSSSQRRTTTSTTTFKKTATTSSSSNLLERAKANYEQCRLRKEDQFDRRTYIPYRNHSLPALPAFGVLDDFTTTMMMPAKDKKDTTGIVTSSCRLPPETACDQTQLTVIFMAYNPDRLGKMYSEMKKLLSYEFVAELVLVWNGERDIYESTEFGKKVVETARVVYPIRDFGLPNDLLNRYHPKVLGDLKTDCLLYYDDDGPFYSKEAIFSALELWKRHSRHQIGAMARHIRSSAQPEKLKDPDDTQFTAYCANDTVDYEFRFFANYDAQMVLPSGSMLHRNYLCYIWHDDMKVIRKFVLEHPVHPDDMTVSMLISQLAGVAPKVYSRRLRPPTTTQTAKQKRRLMEKGRVENGKTITYHDAVSEYDDHAYHQYAMHRRLAAAGMGGVCWDCGSGMTEQKEIWAYLRTEAISSLVRYFGSLTTGSIGWCPMDSPFYMYNRDGRCIPDMAEIGSLPWMNPDGSPKHDCP